MTRADGHRVPADGGHDQVPAEGLSVYARSARALLERDAELAELAAMLGDACQGSGRLSLIEGPAGIGKTRLVEEARSRADSLGMAVLTARGGELERDFGFGIARQLLEPALAAAGTGERAQLLSGAASIAEPVFGAAVAQDQAARPTHALLHGLYWLTANLAERSPVLLAIDDVQWADEPSLRFLLHLARRLDGVRAGIVIASRTGEAETELLHLLLLQARPPILRPRPLSEAAAGRVVRAALGDDADPMLFAACHQATGGNPFLLVELLEELRRSHGTADELSPHAVAQLGPERIARALLLRAGRIGLAAPALVRAVAVLGSRAEIGQAAELAGLDLAQTRATARALAEAAVMEPGEPLRFTHPIVRTSVYEDIAPGERSRLHARAAGLLAARGAAPETIALHLLACDPAGERGRVGTLRQAAHAALSRGAPETAARYLRRALAEPAPQDMRPGLLLELGSVTERSGNPDGLELMRAGIEQAGEARTRAVGGFELGRALLWDARKIDEGVLVLERALESARDPALATRIEAVLLLCGVTSLPARARLAGRLRAARAQAERVPGEADCLLLAPVSVDAATCGPAADAVRLAERALTGDLLLREQVETDLPLVFAPIWALVHAGHLAPAQRTLREATARVASRGSPLGVAMVSAFDAFARHRAGDLALAEAAARTSVELAADAKWGIPTPIAAAVLAEVLVERGELEEARALLRRVEGGFDPETATSQALRESRARLLMAEGDPKGALDQLLAVARWEQGWQLASGIVPVPWRSAAALAKAALGDTDAARELAADELALAQRFGAARPTGTALRVLGRLDPGEQGIARLAAAVAALERSADRLEHARALVDLGSALRRAGRSREARDRLAEGMDLAQRCGAGRLLGAARQQLRLAGARPRRVALTGPGALTPGERRVAQMAAEGMTNKEIAQSLFVTLRTVEMHLSNAYGKLQIASRHDLTRVFRAAGGSGLGWRPATPGRHGGRTWPAPAGRRAPSAQVPRRHRPAMTSARTPIPSAGRDVRPSGATRLGEDPDRGVEAYSRRSGNDRTWKVIDAVRSIAVGRGASMAQIALAWLADRPSVASVIIGARTDAQLEDNLGAVDMHLSAGEIERLDTASDPGAADYPYGRPGIEQRSRAAPGR